MPRPRSSSARHARRRLASGTGALALALQAALAVGVLVVVPASAQAQQAPAASGRLSGTVRDASRTPVSGAQVLLVGTSFGATTDPDGRYRLTGVPAGTYELRVQRIGQRPKSVTGVSVSAGEEATLDVQLETAPTTLGGVVVSASRRVEKVTEAPATITSIGVAQLDESVGNSFAGALKEAKGVDFIQTGMTSIAINARGFNSSFNNRFLMVEDGRISVLPENGLPVGQFTPTPKVDLAGLEVLVGPGSALYGPDASSGVLSLRTKDPKQFPGAVLEVTGGNRSYGDIQGRYAGVTGSGKLGYKVSGEYQSANDWDNYLAYNAGGSVVAPGTAGSVSEKEIKNPIDWKTSAARGSGALVYYAGANRLEINGGMSRTDGVGQTNVGRNQLSGWKYNVAQARWTTPHWFLNAYRAQSQSGQSFALNRYAGAQLSNAANANINADSLRMLSDWPSDGRMYAAEAQGNYEVPAVLNTRIVFGAQYRDDVVSSSRQWLTDRITGKDISNTQKGVYAQTTTPLSRYLDIVLAGRYDKPSSYAAQWSPKAGVVVKPLPDQSFRATFNRAFKSPTILQTNFFIPDWTSIISIYGNTGGFQTVDAAGTVKNSYGPMVPESNKTWEFGYKGVFKDRLFLDGTYFRSDYQNFMSPLTVVGNPFAGAAATYAVPLNNANIPVNAQGRVVNQAGTQPIVLIYYNLGNAKGCGADLLLNFLATNHLELRSTLSTVKITELTVPTGSSPEATSLNSPTTKWTMGATARDMAGVSAGLTWRNVEQYYFRSGSNTGVIPTFGTLDANASYKLPGVLSQARLNVGVSNLFSCAAKNPTFRAAATTPTQPNSIILTEERGCGFGRKHREMINMPYIGMMTFVGVRYAL
jgi:outer membrane receptor for ferrienterochelin and colicins